MDFDANIEHLRMAYWNILLTAGPVLLVALAVGLLIGILQNSEAEIVDIDIALEKIENGTYGQCEECDGEIKIQRLKALPFARQCIECKQALEQQAG